MPDPAPDSVGAALLRAADRDTEIVKQLLKLCQLVDRLGDDLIALRGELVDERTARERLEIRLYAHELRDSDVPLRAAGADEALRDGSWSPTSRNVLPFIREYAPDTEPLPTTAEPAPRVCSHCGKRPTMDPRHDLCAVCDDELAGGHRDA
jgi:hypothetical protein